MNPPPPPSMDLIQVRTGLNSPLILLWIVASILVDLVVATLIRDTWPDLVSILALGLAFGQIGLMAAWLVWGGWNILLRFLLFTGSLCMWSLPVSKCALSGSAHQWVPVLAVYGAAIGAVLAATRLFGAAFASDEQPLDKSRWQYSLWTILSLTTTVAVGVAVVQRIEGIAIQASVMNAYCFGVLAIISMATIWLTFGCRNIITGLAVAGLVCPAAGALILPFTGFAPECRWALALTTLIQGGCIGIAAVVIRISGLRLRWR